MKFMSCFFDQVPDLYIQGLMRNHLGMVLIISFLLPLYSFAENNCFYKTNEAQAELTWKAFKTLKKVPVSGGFKSLKIKGLSEKEVALKQVLTNANIEIDTASVDSGDQARDIKLFKFFFEKLSNKNVAPVFKGRLLRQIGSGEQGRVDLELTFEDQRHLVPMKYFWDQNTLSLEGQIDILSFGWKTAFESISKMCELKHERKTWPDVELLFKIPLVKTCSEKKL